MSHSKVEASRTGRVFSEAFKQDAVRLVVSENYTFAAAAKAVGIGEQSLRKWPARQAPKPERCGENVSRLLYGIETP
ncbi:MAG: transposase [Pirellulaceae bacterium]|nr:transposase [Pirellulaceae bacterium]